MVNHRAKLGEKPAVRCAIYTRKSVTMGLEQEFSSLDAQRESAQAYIKSQASEGWTMVPEVYSDGGYSGGTIERPALKELLAAVCRGEIDCIVVYKVDRLSRSLMDFTKIMEILEQHNCNFVSVTQQLNTTNSMGRLTLNILLSFAQFEREIISERTRDKIIASRKKGRWTGGCPVLGYDIGPDKKIYVNHREAQVVKQIFELYLRHEATYGVVKECRKNNWKTKLWVTRNGKQMGGNSFNKPRVYAIITNPIYAGKVRVGKLTVDGEHEAIVDSATFDQVKAILTRNNNNSGVKVRNKHGALLKGLLFDAKTGYAMGHSFTKSGNKLYRYYVNIMATKEGWDSCETTSVPANEVEAFVVDKIRSLGKDPKLQEAVLDEVVHDLDRRKNTLEADRSKLFKSLTKLSSDIRESAQCEDTSRLRYLREQSAQMEERLNVISEELRQIDSDRLNSSLVLEAMNNFDPCWDQMVPRERCRLLELIIEKILIDTQAGTLAIEFKPSGIKTLLKGDN
ncbi:MAG: recombinase family protein [Opitutales bacterium]|nr:recombinase family protein [Opitutales bacterium]